MVFINYDAANPGVSAELVSAFSF